MGTKRFLAGLRWFLLGVAAASMVPSYAAWAEIHEQARSTAQRKALQDAFNKYAVDQMTDQQAQIDQLTAEFHKKK